MSTEVQGSGLSFLLVPLLKKDQNTPVKKYNYRYNQTCRICQIDIPKFYEKTHANTPQKHLKLLHYELEHPEALIKCVHQDCEQLFVHHQEMQLHYKQKHLGERHQCPHCSKSYAHKDELSLHQDLEHPNLVGGPLNHVCEHPGCNLTFSRPANLHQHQYRSHIKKKRKKPRLAKECPVCHKWVIALKQHIEWKHQRSTHAPCHVCGKTFPHKYALYEHVRRVHQKTVESHPCSICGLSLSSSQGLRSHIRGVHEGIRHFCTQCDKSYQSRNDLNVHIASAHQGIMKHCHFCNLSFSRASERNRHERKCHSELLDVI